MFYWNSLSSNKTKKVSVFQLSQWFGNSRNLKNEQSLYASIEFSKFNPYTAEGGWQISTRSSLGHNSLLLPKNQHSIKSFQLARLTDLAAKALGMFHLPTQ